ncbi:DUF4282 domain-containing protein [Alcanivorax sp. S6407]|uniref:DUF4282 domain-containing protein n=1 Tax=Alcanivorax sp. S6407 TaxID=2926424 RepID=UPI001FF64063|nr:DUF4282 domain-containing protein [Alcanivorax sp. S6407]MCK0152994.1 DUF4282 domain-containing protein [Alcanivorax sp. S6407]
MVDNNEQEPQPVPPKKVNVKLRRGFFWIVQYWRELFNFRFEKYMIIQVLPGVYGIALVAIAMGLLYLCVEAFMASTWRGLFYFFVAAPVTFLVSASVLRALLEFYMVVFKISEHVDELVGLRDTVDRLSGIGDTVDEMVSVTRRIPFWRVLSGRSTDPRAERPSRKEDGKKDRKDKPE